MSANKANFFYNLSIMLDAGMPLLRTVELARQSCGTKISKAVPKIVSLMSAGNSLSDAFKKFPNLFSRFDIVAVEAADRSGSLPEVLRLLSEWHQFLTSIKKKIRSGLILPALILLIAAFVAPLPSFFLGQITLLQALMRSLMIIGVFAIPVVVIVVVIKFTPQGGPLRSILDVVALRIPLLGKALKHYAVSSFCYTFYILYKAALPITDCLDLAIQSMPNAVVAKRLEGGFLYAEKGKSIAEGFKNPFVDGFVELWAMGEESGQLDIVSLKLAKQNREASQHYFEQFAFWLPKVVYALICLEIIYLILCAMQALTGAISSFSSF